MPKHGEEKCIDGSKYRFVSSVSGPESEETTIEYIARLLEIIAEHYNWLGVVTPYEVTIPSQSVKRRVAIDPPARTIRIESDAAVSIWLNSSDGIPINLDGSHRVLYLSDLPPIGAVHSLFVSAVDSAKLYVIGVS